MNKTIIKECTIDDLNVLLKVAIQAFTEAFGPPANTEENFKQYIKSAFSNDKIKNEMMNINSKFYILYEHIDNVNDSVTASSADEELNNINNNTLEPIGYFKLNDLEAQGPDNVGDRTNSIEIERIYLLKKYIGKGYGQAMMDKAIEISKNKKRSYVWLGVWEKNPSSIAFYTKNNFKRFGEHSFIVGDEVQTDYLLKLDL